MIFITNQESNKTGDFCLNRFFIGESSLELINHILNSNYSANDTISKETLEYVIDVLKADKIFKLIDYSSFKEKERRTNMITTQLVISIGGYIKNSPKEEYLIIKIWTMLYIHRSVEDSEGNYRAVYLDGITLKFINSFSKEEYNTINNRIEREYLIYLVDLLKARKTFGKDLLGSYDEITLSVLESSIKNVLNLGDDSEFIVSRV